MSGIFFDVGLASDARPDKASPKGFSQANQGSDLQKTLFQTRGTFPSAQKTMGLEWVPDFTHAEKGTQVSAFGVRRGGGSFGESKGGIPLRLAIRVGE
jgi:hypothetical protein